MRHFVLPATRKHDAKAWAALVSGAADLAANPLPEERDDPTEEEHRECYGCGREIIGSVYTDWNGEPLCGVCAYAADGDHYAK